MSATGGSAIIGTDQVLNEHQRRCLELVLDLIVPAGPDGRPSASEVDVLGYIREREPGSLDDLRASLDRLDEAADASCGGAFDVLDGDTRKRLVDDIRVRDPGFLHTLAMQTVTCYYQDDRVLEAIGLGARPPFPKGYEVPSGDLSLLEAVRRRGKMYRDA